MTEYKVIAHTLGKHRYASTKVFTIGEGGKKRYSYKHWGTLDESNRFHPEVNYFYASTVERDKLIFPADWDMSDLSELSSTRRRGRVSYLAEDVDRQYGATWLLDKVAEETGVKDANKKPETLDFNEIKHISSSLRGKYDALEEKLNLVRKEIDAKEQDLKDAGIFQKSLKSDLSKKIEQLKKQMSQLENELIDLKEKRQIVDNIIEPVSQKIEEYSVNLNRIAERYAVN